MCDIKVLESFKKGKKDDKTCEDMLFISKDFIAVIDGVTSKSDFRYKDQTSGKIAAQLVSETLKLLPADADVKLFVDRANEAINHFYEAVEFPYDRDQVGLQAACVVYSAHFNEIWLIGDCQAAVDGKTYLNPKKSDEILAAFRCLVLQILKDEGEQREETTQKDEARGMILPWILRSTRYANDDTTEYGYSVLNGHPVPDQLIKKITLDTGSHEVILTSDGYPVIERNLEESEKTLSRLLKEDPACCIQIHSTKGMGEGQESFDDRTFVRFLV